MSNERIQAADLRAELRDALNRVEYQHVHIEIYRRGKIAGVLIPADDYERLLQKPDRAVHKPDEDESREDLPDDLTYQPRDRDGWMQWNR